MLSDVVVVLIICHVIKSEENFIAKVTNTPFKIKLEIIYENTTPSNRLTADLGAGEKLNDDKIYTPEVITTEVSKSTNNDSTVYCQNFKTCEECVQSPTWYACGWCHDFGCTNKAEKLCPEAEGIMSVLPVDHKCPRIESKGTFIPEGINFSLKIKLYSPDPLIYEKELICQLKIENRLSHLRAFMIHDTIYCNPVNIVFKENESRVEGVVQVIWGGASPISNKIVFTVYKCEAMAEDCEACRKIPEEYGCGWCASKGRCIIGDNCSADFIKWTLNRMTCTELERKLFFIYN